MITLPSFLRSHLLLIEDNGGDAKLLSEALHEVDRSVVVHHLMFFHDALRYLAKIDEFAGSPTPYLIVLDLNLPRVDGLTGLRVLRDTPTWSGIPVAVMTSSQRPLERSAATDLGAMGCFTKPTEWEDYLRIAKVFSAARPGNREARTH
ncbi:MAG: response regulator [Planctomycetes bacterium]|nr:response regulator [Planctomycetota bacterium]